MKARILPDSVVIKQAIDPETGAVGEKETWSGTAQFSDRHTYTFLWFRPSGRLRLITDVDPHVRFGADFSHVAEHARAFTAKGERRRALLAALYEYELYWAPLEHPKKPLSSP